MAAKKKKPEAADAPDAPPADGDAPDINEVGNPIFCNLAVAETDDLTIIDDAAQVGNTVIVRTIVLIEGESPAVAMVAVRGARIEEDEEGNPFLERVQ